MAVESAKKAALFAEMAEEHSRLAVEMAKPPKAAEPAEPAEIGKPAEAAEPVEPAPKRQRTCRDRSGSELRAEDVEFLKRADEQAAEEAAKPHDAGEWDRYLDAGIDEYFRVEETPTPTPIDSPDSPGWP